MHNSASSWPACLAAGPWLILGMAKKQLTQGQKIEELQQRISDMEQLKNSYRSSAVNLECEIIRLNQETKNQQLAAAGLKDQNTKLVERILALLVAAEIKQS